MPDRDVKTIRDLIYYQYAKIIARRAFSMPDGKEANGSKQGDHLAPDYAMATGYDPS